MIILMNVFQRYFAAQHTKRPSGVGNKPMGKKITVTQKHDF